MSPVCFVTQVLSTLRSSAPRARKGFPQASALRLCSPPLRSALSTPASLRSKGGRSPSPCACYPPPSPGGVRHVCTRRRPIQRPVRQPKGGSTDEYHRRSRQPIHLEHQQAAEP